MKTIAVILASGIGKRFDKKLIKQYQYINNKAVILHSTKVFYDNPNIDKVVLVINKKYIYSYKYEYTYTCNNRYNYKYKCTYNYKYAYKQ